MTTITTTTTNTVAAPSKRLQELIASAEAERDLLQPVLTALRDQADAVLGLVQSHKALASSLRTLEQVVMGSEWVGGRLVDAFICTRM